MSSTEKNKLWEEDEKLFASMVGKYQSEEEMNFFCNMKYKQENDVVATYDCIMSSEDNEDNIVIDRVYYDEYIVHFAVEFPHEVHVMNLSEALAIKMSDVGLEGSEETLFDWLRRRNYRGVRYDRDNDKICGIRH